MIFGNVVSNLAFPAVATCLIGCRIEKAIQYVRDQGYTAAPPNVRASLFMC